MGRRDATALAGFSRLSATVAGRVVRVRLRRDGGWRVRLAETGGALAAAEIPASCALQLPRRGARILVCGRIRYDPVHEWYAIDPVEAWSEAHDA